MGFFWLKQAEDIFRLFLKTQNMSVNTPSFKIIERLRVLRGCLQVDIKRHYTEHIRRKMVEGITCLKRFTDTRGAVALSPLSLDCQV